MTRLRTVQKVRRWLGLRFEHIESITGEYEEVRAGSASGTEGTNDYTRRGSAIRGIWDRSRRPVEPVWKSQWTEVAAGIRTRRIEYREFVRVDRQACPVRVRVDTWSESGSYDSWGPSSMSGGTYVVRFEAE
jgi:hypothetical protein